jgi:hypothetical protein
VFFLQAHWRGPVSFSFGHGYGLIKPAEMGTGEDGNVLPSFFKLPDLPLINPPVFQTISKKIKNGCFSVQVFALPLKKYILTITVYGNSITHAIRGQNQKESPPWAG